ncbi:MAG: TonB-dependent siderophore receptor [Halioglobus sp.]|nr:TonB-dependent siderophore receptor [Halioglobus sp.]
MRNKTGWGATLLCMCFAVAAQTQAQDERGDAAGPGELEEILVLGTAAERYRAGATSALTGLDLDFLELPRVVDVIPEQLLLDQKITELDEALRNVPGVSFSDGFGGSNNDFLIRGFRRNTIYRNGLRVRSNFRVNTNNLEQVQVVKGPAAITYGQVEPGGLVDIVTKKPLEEQRVYLEGRAGTFNSSFFLADWSQPLGERAAIRINASTEQSDTFRDFFDVDRDAIAITGRFELADRTTLTADYEYRDEFRSFDRGSATIPVPGGREIAHRLLDIDISTRFGEPFEEIDTEFEFGSLALEHAFSDNWRVTLIGALESSKSDDFQARPLAIQVYDAGAPITDDGFFTGDAVPQTVYDESSDRVFLVRRSDGSRDRDIEADYLRGIVNGEWRWGGMRHRLALGVDYRDTSESRFFVASAPTDGIPVAEGGNGPLFNLEQPIFGRLERDVSTAGSSPIESEAEDAALFVNDYVEFDDRFAMLLGARIDSSDPDGSGPAESVEEVSPQVALNYRLRDNMIVFASFAEAFVPNTAFTVNDQGIPSTSEVFDPEDSRQFELGSKAELFDRSLQLSLSVYDIEKTNVLTVIDDVPQLVDGQDARGLEVSATGQPAEGFTLFAGYAFTDAEILTGGNSGNRPRNVAEHTANAWLSYEVREGWLSGLGGGVGAFYMGDRYGDDANTWKLGDYTLVDASLWYHLRTDLFRRETQLRFQLAVKNLTDKEYFPASGGDLRIGIGAPRAVIGSIALSL